MSWSAFVDLAQARAGAADQYAGRNPTDNALGVWHFALDVWRHALSERAGRGACNRPASSRSLEGGPTLERRAAYLNPRCSARTEWSRPP